MTPSRTSTAATAEDPSGMPAPGGSPVVHFQGLNSIRAVAALGVVLYHVELYRHHLGEPSLFDTPLRRFVGSLGGNCVQLFFVLSGFLITFLLLAEREREGTVSIRRFYVRRALRIWPLYFGIVILSFAVLPRLALGVPEWFVQERVFNGYILAAKDSWAPTLALYLFFLPNVAMMLCTLVVGASQAWSIGVEEQFYLVWPWLVRWTRGPVLLLSLLLVMPLRYLALHLLELPRGDPSPTLAILRALVRTCPIEFMAVGGIAAYGVHGNWTWFLRWTARPAVPIAAAFAALLQLHRPVHDMFLAATFAVLIVGTTRCLAGRPEPRPLAYLGKISYGIYMYHPAGMYLVSAMAHALVSTADSPSLNHAVFGGLTFVVTIAVSAASYRFFESKFIDLKQRFAVVPSSPT